MTKDEQPTGKEVSNYAVLTHLQYAAGQIDTHLASYSKDYQSISPNERLERAKVIVYIWVHHTIPFVETPRNMHGSYRAMIQITRTVRDAVMALPAQEATHVDDKALCWSIKLVALWLQSATLALLGKQPQTNLLTRACANAKMQVPATSSACVVTDTVPVDVDATLPHDANSVDSTEQPAKTYATKRGKPKDKKP